MKEPRILFIHMSKIYRFDSANLMVRNLFGDFPKEQMAQVYTNKFVGEGDFCGRYYELGRKERRYGSIFYLIKKAGERTTSDFSASRSNVSLRSSRIRVIIKRATEKVIESGLWETVFPIKESDSLNKFINDFKPDMLYTQGYGLSFTALALKIAKRFNIPICYFPVDDWHMALHPWGPVHTKVECIATKIAKKASIRFALGPKMAEELSSRYKAEFECLYHADDLTRFMKGSCEEEEQDKGSVVFGYFGSLYLGRAGSIIDLVRACDLLKKEYLIKIYCPKIPIDIPYELSSSKYVQFLQLPSHEDLPLQIQSCNFLFLPESFDIKYKEAIELSLSTKSHIYMMSGRPILVYGPSYSGTIEYAKRSGWGLVVERRDKIELINGIVKIMNTDIADSLISRAYEVANNNHDIRQLRKTVMSRICNCISI